MLQHIVLSSSPFSCQCQEEIPLQKVYRYSKPCKLDHLSFKITKLAFACSRGNNILIMINRLKILSKGRHFSFTSSKWASNLGWVSRAMQLWQRTPIRLWKENYHFAKTEVDVNKPLSYGLQDYQISIQTVRTHTPSYRLQFSDSTDSVASSTVQNH